MNTCFNNNGRDYIKTKSKLQVRRVKKRKLYTRIIKKRKSCQRVWSKQDQTKQKKKVKNIISYPMAMVQCHCCCHYCCCHHHCSPSLLQWNCSWYFSFCFLSLSSSSCCCCQCLWLLLTSTNPLIVHVANK